MQKWEYQITLEQAALDSPGTKQYIRECYPHERNLPKYMPNFLEPRLNDMGEHGWELIHIEPAYPDRDQALILGHHGKTNAYFCAWKRPKE